MMKNHPIIHLITGFVFLTLTFAQTRKEIKVPDIFDYQTLIGDFHMHTLFSDGNVWPENRVEEAYREGLDIIALTDHDRYRIHEDDIPINYGRAYEIALPKAKELGILLIKGIEITRDMPPGHLNALFIKDIEPLAQAEPMEAIEIAAKQDAYIFWNHPGWDWQLQEDKIIRWYDEHTEMFEKGWLKGIEVVNETEYYPEVFQWALDKNLTLFGNSDVHVNVDHYFEPENGKHRPYTLVFAKEKTLESIREAFEAQRTIIYFKDKIIGRHELLEPFFSGCINIQSEILSLNRNGDVVLMVENISSLPIVLAPSDNALFSIKDEIEIAPGTSERVWVSLPHEFQENFHDIQIPVKVKNYLVGPSQNLETDLPLSVINLNGLRTEIIRNNKYRFLLKEYSQDIDIRYTLNGSTPTAKSAQLNKPVALPLADLKVTYAPFKNNNRLCPPHETTIIIHKGMQATSKLNSTPVEKYILDGGRSLIDGKIGDLNHRHGNWMGFNNNGFDVVVNFDSPEQVDTIAVRFLERNRSWVFLPKSVKIKISEDGTTYTDVLDWKNTQQMAKAPLKVTSIGTRVNTEAKAIHITAENYGICPDWHLGAGDTTWFFVDEIIIR